MGFEKAMLELLEQSERLPIDEMITVYVSRNTFNLIVEKLAWYPFEAISEDEIRLFNKVTYKVKSEEEKL